jgi:transcriptional regulator with XRE-family HTH domain
MGRSKYLSALSTAFFKKAPPGSYYWSMARSAPRLGDRALVDVLRNALNEGALGLSDACRYLRARKGVTQAEFAARVGVALKVIKQLESGTGNPTLASLQRIALSAGLTVTFVQPRATVKLGGMQKHTEDQAKSRQAELRAVTQHANTLKKRHTANALRGRDFTIELPKLS